jgi:6-pyruvoyltetrahydropterin/6-carboxytetrahydropterin synthase
MVTVTKRITFDAAHRLESWTHSKCHRLHGHTWALEATVTGPYENGYVIDFADLSNIIKREIFAKWDHQYLNEVEGLKDATAEELASLAFARIRRALPEEISLLTVRLYETPDCWVEVA